MAFVRNYGFLRTAGSTPTATLNGVSLTVGNLAAVILWWYNNMTDAITVTDSVGNIWTKVPGTFRQNPSTGTPYTGQQIWVAPITVGGAGITITATFPVNAFYPAMAGVEFSGRDLTTPVAGATGAQGFGAPNSGAITTSAACDLFGALYDDTGGSGGVGSGWSIGSAQFGYYVQEYQSGAPGGTYSASSSNGGSVQFVGGVVALKAATGGGGGGPSVSSAPFGLLLATPANQTDSFAHGADESNTFPFGLASSPIGGPSAGAGAVTTSHRTGVAGNLQLLFGSNLFERIIVMPRVKAVGFVLSATQFPVEIWNTFHDAAEPLTAIDVTGTGGITITNPYSLPKSIGPKDSLILEALVPSSGDVTINQDVVFVFTGISGTDMTVTGSRIMVFSVAPDFQEGIDETISYLTDVFKAYDDTEQRRGLRSLPRRGLKFRALTLEARDAAGMESLLWGWQHQAYGVPFWQDAQPLEADIAAGQFTIQVNTVDRLFAVGGIAVLWKDEFTFEAGSIASITTDSITLAAPTQFPWSAGVKVVPVFLGRIANAVELTRLTCFADQLDIEFQGEGLQVAPAPTVTPAQFKGFDVLEIPPNWAKELKRNYARSTILMDPKTGPITVDDKGGTPVVSHELPWWIDSHAKVTALRAFLLARYGQLVPFWVPTWDQDLVLATNTAAGSAVLNIKSVFYTRFFFPDKARRCLALISLAGGARYVEVTGAEDNGNGTESLTLSAALTADVIASLTMVSFLTFCRLGTDDIKITWSSTEVAEALVPIQEIPRELP